MEGLDVAGEGADERIGLHGLLRLVGHARPPQPKPGAATAGSARDDTADGAELHRSARSGAGTVAARLTLVTLAFTAFNIATSGARVDAAVNLPSVLRLPGHRVERIG